MRIRSILKVLSAAALLGLAGVLGACGGGESVALAPAAEVSIISFAVTPADSESGAGASLSWQVLNASYCVIEPGVGEVGTESDGLAVTLDGPTDFTLTCYGPRGPASRTAAAEAPTPAPTGAPLRMVEIPAGSFVMGSPETELGRKGDETQHEVVLSRPFLMSATEITQWQWTEVMGRNPSFFADCGPDCPVEQVIWIEAVSFSNRLSEIEGLTPCYAGVSTHIDNLAEGTVAAACGPGDEIEMVDGCTGYRLPTEAEWEYAARAGAESAFSTGDITTTFCTDPALDEAGWYCGNADGSPHPAAGKAPNAWGLYDMHGDAAEWVWDFYHGDYAAAPQTDPTGPEEGPLRVVRGGSWLDGPARCRSAARTSFSGYERSSRIGFRVVRAKP